MHRQLFLVLSDERNGNVFRVPLEPTDGKSPGLARVHVSVEDETGRKVVRRYPYHFDVRHPDTIDLERYVEEPEELPFLEAFLQVEPYQR